MQDRMKSAQYTENANYFIPSILLQAVEVAKGL